MDGDVRGVIVAADPALWVPEGRPGPPPAGVELLDVVPLPSGTLAVGRIDEECLLAPVVLDAGRPRRARAGDGLFAQIGRAVSGAVPGLSGRPIGAVDVEGAERSLGDHTNELAVVGERAVVKLFPRTTEGPQPGVELPAHLAAVGFAELPAPIGSVWWRDALVATVSTYVGGASDGWEWYVAAVGSAAAGEVSWDAVEGHAGAIGRLVARLHVALATPSPELPSPVRWASADHVAGWRLAAEATLDVALASIHGAEGERLRAIEASVRAALRQLDGIDRTPVMRIHGDLHVGQILRTADDELLVNDFDGNPVARLDARDELQAPARDLAWMLASIDHVGRVVARRRPDAAGEAIAWIERARDSFLDVYRDGLGDRGDLLDERLLGPFSVAQEAHEFVYAARFGPAWRYVPDAALPAALGRLGAR